MADDKKAVPEDVSSDIATIKMLRIAQERGQETIFDRAVKMKQCNIGTEGICCKVCSQGPCRLPLTKGIKDGTEPDNRKGLCGATPETIAARNLVRQIAAGCAAHSDHGRGVVETFRAMAYGEAKDYTIKDELKLREVAGYFGVATTVKDGDKEKVRDKWDIAREVADIALGQWGQQQGEMLYLSRAPKPTQDRWEKHGVKPRGIDREVVEIMHRTHMGVDQDYRNLLKQGARCSLGNGWGGSMMATDLQDVMFGTPYPNTGEINLGVLSHTKVNIIVHGHDPLLSEMIVAAVHTPDMIEYAKAQGAEGYVVAGMCCTANEILVRHGMPIAGDYLQQELAVVTGAVEAMVVDIQCIMENLANISSCYHTKFITTMPIAKCASGKNTMHVEFEEHHAMDKAKEIVKIAADNFKNRKEVQIPTEKTKMVVGFSTEAIKYHLGGTFRGSFVPLNDNIINGRIRGICGVVGCNNARVEHDEVHLALIKELIKHDVIVLTTGCSAMACGKAGLLTPESAAVYAGAGLAEVCETVGIPPVLHMGACVDNSRILTAAAEVIKAGGLGKELADLPAAGAAPGWMSEKAVGIGQYFVTSGVYVMLGVPLSIYGAPKLVDLLEKEMEELYGATWAYDPDPISAAHKIIAHIDKKRAALGINQARERVLMDMADRQKIEAA
ncbi:MAG: carbon monoxide dehydrogenase [Candidatus Adiutrix intracellularis]|jgi:carbon-monoxide dehydrogenase catalytic subunit|nr:MAG: carbon monoxide dehydrogenase [Candidatus Adiutrix intracellularis]MDR2827205.1 anaerobic carbon-monoxide dehydrogenase catalytic subunit [Candidatus Adiutrix intracellularis]